MRRLGFAVSFLLVFLLGLTGGAWVFRADLAEAAAQRWLAARGVPAQLTVARLDFDRLVITELRLGRPATASAEEVALAIAWPSLLAPEIAGLTAETLRVRLDLTGEGPLLGALQPLLDGAAPEAAERTGEDQAAPQPPAGPTADPSPDMVLPTFPVGIADLTVYAQTAVGAAELRLDGTAEPVGAGPKAAGLKADITLQGVTPIAVFGGRLQAEATSQSLSRLQADLRVAAEDQGLEGRLIADVADLPAAPAGRLTAELTAGPRAAALLAPLLPAPVTWEELALTLDLDGRLSAIEAEQPWLAWLEDGEWSAAATLTGHDLAWPERASGAQLLLALDAAQRDRTLSVFPAQTAELSIPRLDPAFLDSLALPDDLRAQVAGGIALRLLPLVEGRPLAALERGPQTIAVRPAARVGLETGTAAAVAALHGQLLFNSNFGLQFVDLKEFNLSFSDWAVAGQQVITAAVAGRLAGPPDAVVGALDISSQVVPALPNLAIERVGAAWPADLQASLQARELSLTGPLSLTARALRGDGLGLSSLAARLNADLQITPHGLDLAAPGNLASEDLRYGPRRVPELRALLEENRVHWRPGNLLHHRLAARWTPLELRIEQDGGTLVEAGLEPGRWQVEGRLDEAGYQGSLTVEDAGLALQDPPLRLEGLRLASPLPPEAGRPLDLAGRLTSGAEAPLLPPLDLTGSLEPQGDAYGIALSGRGLGGRLSAVARATLDPRAPRLRATLTLAPLAFAPSELQPGDLTPLLSDLANVSGRLQAGVAVDWAAGHPKTDGRVELDDLQFDYGEGVRVSGLSGLLAFDSLWPLQAPPPQELTAARVEAGIPMTELTAAVGVTTPPESELPRLQIVSASAQAFGGRLTLEQGLIDLEANREEAILGLESIDVAELLAVLDLPDVEATGRISGEIPLRLEGDTVTIGGARLAAEAPGILRLTSDAAKEALAAGGASVELMMQALEDFQYETLALTLDKPAEGTTLLTLKLLGQNPEVLEGQPFDVNVRLETDLAPLLLALSEALALTDEAFGRLWRLRR